MIATQASHYLVYYYLLSSLLLIAIPGWIIASCYYETPDEQYGIAPACNYFITPPDSSPEQNTTKNSTTLPTPHVPALRRARRSADRTPFRVTKHLPSKMAITQTTSPLSTTFWYNSSNLHVATYSFDYCDIVPCPGDVSTQCTIYQDIPSRSVYMCIGDDDWSKNCKYWNADGWDSDAGLRWATSVLTEKDRIRRSLIERMTLSKSGICLSAGKPGQSMKLTLTIENPSPIDSGPYMLSFWDGGALSEAKGSFQLQDMVNSSEWNKIVPKIYQNLGQTLINTQSPSQGMIAMVDPSPRDTMALETGYSDKNLWLEWMAFSAKQYNRSNCYVCGNARTHLGTVPLNIPSNAESCFLSLYANTIVNQSTCIAWKEKYPIITKTPHLSEGITIYPGNYTCYRGRGKGRFLGNFTPGYCYKYSNLNTHNHTQSLGDIYWICGDMKIRIRLEGRWSGECALAKVIMPLHILGVDDIHIRIDDIHIHTHRTSSHRTRRQTKAIPGSFDPHVYIDAIGVPRGVPDEFKARDQVKAGFESIFPIITANKNVDWINYIFYNQQRFVNYTRDALKGIAEQLGPTSYMTFKTAWP
ncbi:uncharacterized protein LOC128660210 [Bombina bombina]|uniref:uncharacterized protein LOC128660210 n=1 Tax=Bombina bombina TaxID=8345 RepID=UPI00235AC7E7|nr:uncharacterized protein LOC128660210 [Bombina bombina]